MRSGDELIVGTDKSPYVFRFEIATPAWLRRGVGHRLELPWGVQLGTPAKQASRPRKGAQETKRRSVAAEKKATRKAAKKR